MTFIPTSPNPQDPPSVQVTQVQTNFAQFAAIFSSTVGGINYNHTALNDPNQGDHESVILQNQATDPVVTNSFASLYARNATSNAGTQPQLFLRIPKFLPNQFDETNATNTPMQFTYNTVNTSGPVYQTFFVGGYLFYFGTVTATGVVTLSPAGTTLLMAIAVPNQLTLGAPSTVSTKILTASTFQIFSNASGVFSFNWMAIATV